MMETNNMEHPKNAVGYIRCSTEMQEDSPEQQRKEIIAFAGRNNFNMVEWFEDFGVSGTTFDRPGFRRMAAKIAAGPDFELVICYDESRLGRSIDPDEAAHWRFKFRKKNVKILLVHTSIAPDHEMAPMVRALEGMQASQYSKKLSEVTKRGAMSNGPYSNGGTPPYGYIRIAVNSKTGNKRILQHGEWSISGQEKVLWDIGKPEEVEIVKLIFARRAIGTAAVLIAGELNDKNIPCPQRGRWRNKD
jgi:DNA invertase Pin-like site-specific DNA recombinase